MGRVVRNLRSNERKRHLGMLNLCFGSWGDERKWERLYLEKGFDITKNVIVVEEDGQWMGGGTAWFREAFLKTNKKIKVYIAGDGYVHPNHRGKGVYSTFMRSLNELAQKQGAPLGFGFISIYGIPFKAAPKHGFANLFYPVTKILPLNPENFLSYLFDQLKELSLPVNFEGLKLKFIVLFRKHKRKCTVNKIFQIKNRKLCELLSHKDDVALDLILQTDIGTLLSIFTHFRRRKRAVIPVVIANFLLGRLRFRFSINFVKLLLKV